jgi:hypothetical protein
MYEEIDTWINGYKVRGFPWIDRKTYYLNVQYFKPGSSIHKPVWEKTVYITINEQCERIIHNCLHSLITQICSMDILKDDKVVLTFQ